MLDIIIGVLVFWFGILATVAANPIVAAFVFAGLVTGLVLVFQWFGWLWGLGALTLVGLASGPALLLTPVILVITLLARFKGQGTSGSETTHAPRPILLEPRDANRSR
jgi:hypothetical protein